MGYRILVVGGGVAGPSLGIALKKLGSGADVTIIEAYPRPVDDQKILGSYFTLQNNGVDALRTLGALQSVRNVGFDTTSSNMMRGDGGVLGTIPFGNSITVKRGEVNRILMDKAKDAGCTVRFGTRLVSCRQTTTSGNPAAAGSSPATVVALLSSNGKEEEELTFDLVVGADGVHSLLRKTIDPDAPLGRFVGLVNYAGVAPPPPAGVMRPPGSSLTPQAWNFCFGRNAFILYHVRPDGHVVWGVNEPQAQRIEPAVRAAMTTESVRDYLVKLFIDDHNPLLTYLVSHGPIELMGDNQCDLEHVPHWYNAEKNLVLVGDAVHAPSPTSGQGGSMALEDGIVLAKALHETSSVAAALELYTNFRRPRVEKIVAEGARMSKNKMPNAFGRFMRDLCMPIAMKCIDMAELNRWVGDFRIVWDLPLTQQPPPPTSNMWKAFQNGIVGLSGVALATTVVVASVVWKR